MFFILTTNKGTEFFLPYTKVSVCLQRCVSCQNMRVHVLEITVAGTLTRMQKLAWSSLTRDAVGTGITF
jgi:uncharacterized Fe-S radical SAM superfamily protein PflX